MEKNNGAKLFSHPFSKEYWRLAFRELKNPKMLVFAALVLTLRVILKPLKIPVTADLSEGVGFIVNAFGSMVYGPVLALLNGALSDTLGYLMHPDGPYFAPFMITEMAGSFVYALFLYRAKVNTPRLLLSRFCICFFVNVALAYPIFVLYYSMMLGKDYNIALIRVVKNIAMFPIETIILVLVFRSLLPPFERMGFVHAGAENLSMDKKHIALLAALFVAGAGLTFWYGVWSYNTTSLSASYTPEQRLNRNRAIEQYVLEKHPELDAEDTVCIIESALPKAFSPEVTYQVAVYRADVTGSEDPAALMKELEGLSKSKAAARKEMTKLLNETVVLTQNGREPEKNMERK